MQSRCPASTRSGYDFAKFKTKAASMDEVISYLLQAPVQKADPRPIDDWHNQPNLPALSAFCQMLHAIPATSTPSERLFSRAKFVINDRRSALKPRMVDDLLFLKSNWNRFVASILCCCHSPFSMFRNLFPVDHLPRRHSNSLR